MADELIGLTELARQRHVSSPELLRELMGLSVDFLVPLPTGKELIAKPTTQGLLEQPGGRALTKQGMLPAVFGDASYLVLPMDKVRALTVEDNVTVSQFYAAYTLDEKGLIEKFVSRVYPPLHESFQAAAGQIRKRWRFQLGFGYAAYFEIVESGVGQELLAPVTAESLDVSWKDIRLIKGQIPHLLPRENPYYRHWADGYCDGVERAMQGNPLPVQLRAAVAAALKYWDVAKPGDRMPAFAKEIAGDLQNAVFWKDNPEAKMGKERAEKVATVICHRYPKAAMDDMDVEEELPEHREVIKDASKNPEVAVEESGLGMVLTCWCEYWADADLWDSLNCRRDREEEKLARDATNGFLRDKGASEKVSKNIARLLASTRGREEK